MSRKTSASIRRQLQLFFVGLLASTVVVMGTAWFWYNQELLKDEAERVVSAESDILGVALRPALMFNDERLATRLLQSMKFDADISVVKLFTIDGNVLATYALHSDDDLEARDIPFRDAAGSEFVNGKLRLYRVVRQKMSPVGVVVVESRLLHLRNSERSSIIAIFAAVVACLVFGLLIVRRLQKKIVSPITSLATLMQRMGESGDYGLRMDAEASIRELEELVAGFNQMARQIQSNFKTIEEQQEDLRKREARFRQIVEDAPLPVIITRLSDGQVMFVNRPAAEMFLIQQDEAWNFKATDFYDPNERPGLMSKLVERGGLRGEELEVVRSDGSRRVISLSMNIMPFEGEQALLSACFDITEQKHAEEMLEQHNQLLEDQVRERTAELQATRDELMSTLDNMMDTYYKILPDGSVGWASASISSLLGYQPFEIAGLYLKTLCIDHRAYVRIVARLKSSSGVLVNQKTRLRHKQGHAVWVSFSAHWVLDEHGELAGIEGVARDISAIVEAEQQKSDMERKMVHVQRLESLGVLAGGIAHDFNNILTGILTNAELAQLNLQDGLEAQNELKGIVASSIRASDLCQQMLAYSGQGSFRREDLNLTELVEEALQLIDVSIPKHVSLRLDLATELPAIHADRTQLQQVIMNLVTNAAESIGEGQAGHISILTSKLHAGKKELESRFIDAEPEPGDYVLLEVADNGCGMSQEVIEKMFEPFFTTKFTGRGLGMSAVLGIVRSHCGTIQVSSRPGNGSRFRILLPASHWRQDVPAVDAAGSVKGQPAGLKVLVVEDDTAVSAVVRRLLERMGCEVMVASDGHAGVETYRQNRTDIDLVLLDLTMPVMDGCEALKRLREINPVLPVYICSGYSFERVETRFSEVRPNGFLQKPFTMKMLQQVLSDLGGEGE